MANRVSRKQYDWTTHLSLASIAMIVFSWFFIVSMLIQINPKTAKYDELTSLIKVELKDASNASNIDTAKAAMDNAIKLFHDPLIRTNQLEARSSENELGKFGKKLYLSRKHLYDVGKSGSFSDQETAILQIRREFMDVNSDIPIPDIRDEETNGKLGWVIYGVSMPVLCVLTVLAICMGYSIIRDLILNY